MKPRNSYLGIAGLTLSLALVGCSADAGLRKLDNGGTGAQASSDLYGPSVEAGGAKRTNPINSQSGTAGTGVGYPKPAAAGPGTPANPTGSAPNQSQGNAPVNSGAGPGPAPSNSAAPAPANGAEHAQPK